ncbi:unnamed protein product [Rhizoctonia solani]|nr:unnamed protein product [Rhizoctonia solani]
MSQGSTGEKTLFKLVRNRASRIRLHENAFLYNRIAWRGPDTTSGNLGLTSGAQASRFVAKEELKDLNSLLKTGEPLHAFIDRGPCIHVLILTKEWSRLFSLAGIIDQGRTPVLKGVDGALYHAQQVVDQLIQPNARVERYDVYRFDQSSSSIVPIRVGWKTLDVVHMLVEARAFIISEGDKPGSMWIGCEALNKNPSFDGWGPRHRIHFKSGLPNVVPASSREEDIRSEEESVRSKEKGHSSVEQGIANTSQGPQEDSTGGSQKGSNGELQRKIRRLRDKLNGYITAYTTATGSIFISTPNNAQALRICSTAASQYLKSLLVKHGTQVQTKEQLNSAVKLLESYRRRTAILEAQELQYLIIGTTILLSSLLNGSPPAIGARYVMHLLQIVNGTENGQNQLALEYLSFPLLVFALSQHDYPGWSQPPPLNAISRAERTIEVITYYVANPEMLGGASSTMINLGLLELLSDPGGYKLEDADIVAIAEAFDPMGEDDHTYIHTLPENSSPHSFSRMVSSMATIALNERNGIITKECATVACLTVMNRTGMDQSAPDSPLGEVYAFVVECVLDLPASGPDARGQNAALDLMQKFHDPSYPERRESLIANLAQPLEARGLFTRLNQHTDLGASDDKNFSGITKLFATGQALFLIDLALRSGVTDDEYWRRCLNSFVGDEGMWESPELATSRLVEHRNILAEGYRGMYELDRMSRHHYFEILYDSLARPSSS